MEAEKLYNPKTAFGNKDLIVQIRQENAEIKRQEEIKACNRCDYRGLREEDCDQCDGRGRLEIPCDHQPERI